MRGGRVCGYRPARDGNPQGIALRPPATQGTSGQVGQGFTCLPAGALLLVWARTKTCPPSRAAQASFRIPGSVIRNSEAGGSADIGPPATAIHKGLPYVGQGFTCLPAGRCLASSLGQGENLRPNLISPEISLCSMVLKSSLSVAFFLYFHFLIHVFHFCLLFMFKKLRLYSSISPPSAKLKYLLSPIMM